MIHWDTMQLGDSTRVHCKNNIRNTIEKVNSSQFLVLVNFFRSHRIYYWAFILPQDVQLQLKSSPRLYSFNCIIPGDRLLESLWYNISWTWSQVVESNTNNKWCFLVDTKGWITPKDSKMVGIYDENVFFHICQ